MVDGVDLASAANELFHQIKELKEQQASLRGTGSTLFVPESALHECQGLEGRVRTRLPNGLCLLNSLAAAGMTFPRR